MGFWDTVFGRSGSDHDTKVQCRKEDNASVRGHKFTHTEGGGHVHQSYNLDTTSGQYREYHGGENSSDRHYNR